MPGVEEQAESRRRTRKLLCRITQEAESQPHPVGFTAGNRPPHPAACPQLHLPHSTDLPYVESQRDGIIKIGVGTSCINPEMPQNREQEGAENEHT